MASISLESYEISRSWSLIFRFIEAQILVYTDLCLLALDQGADKFKLKRTASGTM